MLPAPKADAGDGRTTTSTTQINSLVTVHLKSDLENRPVSWKFCADPPRTIMYSNVGNNDNDLTKYGILRNVQLYLSQIRTDLDSFNDAEAFALMYSGYAQTKYETKRQKEEQHSPEDIFAEDAYEWKFFQVRDYLTLPAKAVEKEKILKEASRVPFKLFYLSAIVKYLTLVFAALVFIGLVYMAFDSELGDYSIVNITVKLVVFILILFLVGIISKVLATILNIKSTVRKNVAFAVLLVVAWAISNLYLFFLNGIYNRYGKLDKEQ